MTDSSAVRAIGLGLAALGRPGYLTVGHGRDFASGATVDDLRTRTHELLDFAWDAGVRYIDAARSYGLAERFLGEWLAARPGRRDALIIGSKWGYTYTGDWQIDADVHEVKDHSAATFERQWTQTQDALGGPPDIYLVHSLTSDSPVLDDSGLIGYLTGLAEEGVIVGFSTSGPDQSDVIDRALAMADDVPFRAVQTTWNVLEPSAGPALARAHHAGWFVVAKEAVANGRLTDRGDVPRFQAAAQSAGLSPDVLAIATAVHQPFVDITLSGAATIDQLRSNLDAATVGSDIVHDLPAGLAENPDDYWSTRSDLPWT